jgi:hypothetical protein
MKWVDCFQGCGHTVINPLHCTTRPMQCDLCTKRFVTPRSHPSPIPKSRDPTQVGRSVRKKRIAKARQIEALANDPITFTEADTLHLQSMSKKARTRAHRSTGRHALLSKQTAAGASPARVRTRSRAAAIDEQASASAQDNGPAGPPHSQPPPSVYQGSNAPGSKAIMYTKMKKKKRRTNKFKACSGAVDAGTWLDVTAAPGVAAGTFPRAASSNCGASNEHEQGKSDYAEARACKGSQAGAREKKTSGRAHSINLAPKSANREVKGATQAPALGQIACGNGVSLAQSAGGKRARGEVRGIGQRMPGCAKGGRGGAVANEAAGSGAVRETSGSSAMRQALDSGSTTRAARSWRAGAGVDFLHKMRTQLHGGRFRMLNERLYTSTGNQAFDEMQVRCTAARLQS